MNQLVPFAARTPALVAAAGARASYRFFEFFTAQIKNPNTRRGWMVIGQIMPFNPAAATRDRVMPPLRGLLLHRRVH